MTDKYENDNFSGFCTMCGQEFCGEKIDKLVAALEKIYDLAAVEADEGSVIAMQALEAFKGDES